MGLILQVPDKQCRQEHRKIPKLKTRRVPIRSCKNRNGDWEEIPNPLPRADYDEERDFDNREPLDPVAAREGFDPDAVIFE